MGDHILSLGEAKRHHDVGNLLKEPAHDAAYFERISDLTKAGFNRAALLEYRSHHDDIHLRQACAEKLMIALLDAFELRSLRLAARAYHAAVSGSTGKPNSKWSVNDVDMDSVMYELTKASMAHAQLLVLRAFFYSITSKTAQCPRGWVPILSDLGIFLALWWMDGKMGEFRDGDYVSTSDSQLISSTITSVSLCALRPYVIVLGDAWDFSDLHLYSSAIGRYDGHVYEALVQSCKDEPLNQHGEGDDVNGHGEVPHGYTEFLGPLLKAQTLSSSASNSIPKHQNSSSRL